MHGATAAVSAGAPVVDGLPAAVSSTSGPLPLNLVVASLVSEFRGCPTGRSTSPPTSRRIRRAPPSPAEGSLPAKPATLSSGVVDDPAEGRVADDRRCAGHSSSGSCRRCPLTHRRSAGDAASSWVDPDVDADTFKASGALSPSSTRIRGTTVAARSTPSARACSRSGFAKGAAALPAVAHGGRPGCAPPRRAGRAASLSPPRPSRSALARSPTLPRSADSAASESSFPVPLPRNVSLESVTLRAAVSTRGQSRLQSWTSGPAPTYTSLPGASLSRSRSADRLRGRPAAGRGVRRLAAGAAVAARTSSQAGSEPGPCSSSAFSAAVPSPPVDLVGEAASVPIASFSTPTHRSAIPDPSSAKTRSPIGAVTPERRFVCRQLRYQMNPGHGLKAVMKPSRVGDASTSPSLFVSTDHHVAALCSCYHVGLPHRFCWRRSCASACRSSLRAAGMTATPPSARSCRGMAFPPNVAGRPDCVVGGETNIAASGSCS